MRSYLRRPGLLISGVMILLLGWFLRPAAPVDLRAVHAAALAQREAAAWRAYYEERYPALFWQVLQVTRSEYGFSLWDSLRMSFHAARAAMHFRRSNDPALVARALVGTENYYRIIARGSRQQFDFREVARLELRWWRMRREKLPPEEWAQTIARQCELIYGVPAADFLPSVRLRVQAMVQRDAGRNVQMTDGDWQRIREILVRSARMFAEVCHGPRTSGQDQTAGGLSRHRPDSLTTGDG